jgi:conjugative transfer signal peptidase TraF
MPLPTFNHSKLAQTCQNLAKYTLFALGAFLVCTFSLLSAMRFLHISVNTTESLPAKAFIETGKPATKGGIALFCPDLTQASMMSMAQRGAFKQEPGSDCTGHFVRFAKVVFAVEGDVVSTTAAGLVVNGLLLPKTAPMRRDSRGLPMVHYPYGTYSVGPGEAWVASTYHERSFDSRYYGPVKTSALVGARTLF